MSEKNPAEQHAARLEALHAAMWNDTSPRGVEYRAKAKELFPDVVTPDDQFAPAVAPLRAELDETKAQLTKFGDIAGVPNEQGSSGICVQSHHVGRKLQLLRADAAREHHGDCRGNQCACDLDFHIPPLVHSGL